VEAFTRNDVIYPPGTVGDLIRAWRESEDFKALSDSTQTNYGTHLNRFKNPEAWGLLKARALTAAGVLAARDALRDTPGMANQMLAVGRSLWAWGIPQNYAEHNPFERVKDLAIPDRGHVPWPRWVIDEVLANAPGDVVRTVRLGTMTCQRESDLIRLGPGHRERAGIWCRPKKTRKKRRAFFIPLATTDALELDRWAKQPIRFENSRWKAPIERHNADLYIYSPRAAAYSTSSLRARWGRFLKRTAAGKDICRRWKAWLAEKVEQYEWEIDPDEVRGPTIHGLRGTGILLRHAEGYSVDQISNDVGMSRQMVDHYMRFKDQMEVAEQGRGRLRLVP
jgi:integrase